MSRRFIAFMAAIALAASLGVTTTATAGHAAGTRAAHASVQIDVGLASHRIEVLRPKGYGGSDQPESKRPGAANGAAVSAAVPQNGIQYHGGPVVMGEKVVAIYWASSTIFTGGPAAGTTGTGASDGSLIGYFLSNLGGTPYYNINTTYTDANGTPIPNSMTYTGFWANNTNIAGDCAVVSDAAIQTMIKSGFSSGKITYDAKTVYTVFSAGKVNLGGNFGNCPGTQFQYCAYHGYFSYNNRTVLYAAMPYNAAYTGTGCTAFAAGGPPNADPGADAEVNTLAHELEEANTDPRLNAWWTTSDGSENADKCAWTFGNINLNNNTANITVGARNFLVQRNWLNLNGGSCAQTYGSAAPTVPGAPNLTSATPGNAQVALAWSAPASNGGAAVDGYYVYRNGSKVNGGALVAGTSFTDGGLTNGTSYSYTVTAHNSVGEGAQSNSRSATPSAGASVPGATTVSASTNPRSCLFGNFFCSGGGVKLTWTVPASNGSAISQYRIYRSTTSTVSTGGSPYATSTGTSYTNTAAAKGTVYYYKVVAVNGVGTGPDSNVASATAG